MKKKVKVLKINNVTEKQTVKALKCANVLHDFFMKSDMYCEAVDTSNLISTLVEHFIQYQK